MRSNLKKLVGGVAALTLVAGLAACADSNTGDNGNGDSPSASEDTGPIKVGIPIALSGPVAAVGSWARAGVEIAINNVNEAGGVNGRELEAVFVDTEADPTKAVTMTTRLINQDKVDIIVGPMTSDESLATMSMLTDANIASVNGSGSAITPENAPLSLALLPNAEYQAQRMAEYAVELYGTDGIATVNYSATQGQTAAEAWDRAFEELGVEPVAQAEYDMPVTDMTPQVLSIQQADPEVILAFTQTGEDTARLVQAMKELNLDIPVIGSYASTFKAQAESIVPDVYDYIDSVTWTAFSACSAEEVRPNASAFVTSLNDDYTEDQLNFMSYDYAAGYHDAVVLLVAAIEATDSTDGDVIIDWLETEGPASAETNPLMVHQDYAMSDTNHFLMDTSSMALVNPGVEVEEQIFERIDCSS